MAWGNSCSTRGGLQFQRECAVATDENLAERVACLERADLREDVNHAIVRGQLRTVRAEIKRRKEHGMGGKDESSSICLVPDCDRPGRPIQRGLCATHYKDVAMRREYGLPSRRGRRAAGNVPSIPDPPPPPPAAKPKVTRPQAHGQAECPVTDRVIRPAMLRMDIPVDALGSGLAAELLHAGARVVKADG